MQLSSARKVLASCLVIPPVLWALSTLIGPDLGTGSSTADQLKSLNKIAQHKGAYVASNLLFLFAAMLFIAATYGIVHVYRGRKVGVGQVAGVLLAIAMAVFFAFYGIGLIQYEMVSRAEFRGPVSQLLFARLLHFEQSSGLGTVLFIVFLVGIVLGPVLLGIAMIRRRNVPLWAGILIIVSGPIGFFATGKVGGTIEQVVVLVGLTPLALLIWRMSDEQWDAPREIAGARPDRLAKPEPVVPGPAPPAPAV